MLSVIGSVAQFERELMLERQREGIAKAAAEGKYKGKQRAFSDKRLQELQAEGLTQRSPDRKAVGCDPASHLQAAQLRGAAMDKARITPGLCVSGVSWRPAPVHDTCA